MRDLGGYGGGILDCGFLKGRYSFLSFDRYEGQGAWKRRRWSVEWESKNSLPAFWVSARTQNLVKHWSSRQSFLFSPSMADLTTTEHKIAGLQLLLQIPTTGDDPGWFAPPRNWTSLSFQTHCFSWNKTCQRRILLHYQKRSEAFDKNLTGFFKVEATLIITAIVVHDPKGLLHLSEKLQHPPHRCECWATQLAFGFNLGLANHWENACQMRARCEASLSYLNHARVGQFYTRKWRILRLKLSIYEGVMVVLNFL